MESTTKPKLLFLRFSRPGLPAYIRLHLQQQVNCLSQFFEVTVIDRPGDYGRLCDEHEPDLTLFESGIYVGDRDLKNVFAHPEIPKLGFCHCDAYCETRGVFVSDMARWGVETFFTTSVSLASYTPSLVNSLFVWPNFVDATLYYDYRLPKIIPALFTGSQAIHYPWRNRVTKIISQHYSSLQCPHFGWSGENATARMASGEPYARMINAAWIAPTCGTIANEVVRKHFEIPACNTCLVTQRTAALEAAGFSDLVNCVFTEGTDVLDKLEWLFGHLDELQNIAQAGHDLVHARHTMQHRDQIFQWFALNKQLKPHQMVVQVSPFMPLSIVDRSSGIKNGHFNSEGFDRVLMAQGDDKLWSGHYDEAEILYQRCLNYHNMPEPKLRLALCCLYKGNVDGAIFWVSKEFRKAVEKFNAVEPDPVEWAYFIVALLCRGKLQEAVERANQFESLCHPELERVRTVIAMLSDRVQRRVRYDTQPKYRFSVHQLPERTMDRWLNDLCVMLKSCGKTETAERITRAAAKWKPAVASDWANGETSRKTIGVVEPAVSSVGEREGMELGARAEGGRVVLFSDGGTLGSWLRRYVKPVALGALQRVELGVGYFLPYKWSAMGNEESVSAVHELLRKEDIKSGLLIGAAAGEGATEAFLAGLDENPNKPRGVCLNISTARFRRLQKRLTKSALVQCRCICEETGWEKSAAESFDAVVIDGSELIGAVGYAGVQKADIVVIYDINGIHTYNVCRSMLADPSYSLVAYDPSYRGGYAIFRKEIVG